MARVLLGLVFVVGLAATGVAANIHFALPGTAGPVRNLDVDTRGGVVTLELHFDGEGTGFSGGHVNMTTNSSPELLPLVHVSWFWEWGIWSGFDGIGFYAVWHIVGGLPGDNPIATFRLTVPGGLPASTVLRLTADDGPGPGNWSEIWDWIGNALPTTFTDLVIHITPEPGVLGLLVLGGMAAMRRRRGAR